MAKAKRKRVEPTPDEIVGTILEMLGTLQILDRLRDVPFQANIKNALKRFDRPALRSSLVDRLYHPERYVSR